MIDILGRNEDLIVWIWFFLLAFWVTSDDDFFENIGIAVLTKIDDKSNLMMELHYVYLWSILCNYQDIHVLTNKGWMLILMNKIVILVQRTHCAATILLTYNR